MVREKDGRGYTLNKVALRELWEEFGFYPTDNERALKNLNREVQSDFPITKSGASVHDIGDRKRPEAGRATTKALSMKCGNIYFAYFTQGIMKWSNENTCESVFENIEVLNT